MDQCQQELRRAAAKAFRESLDQLEETFQPAQPPANSVRKQPQSDSPAACFDMESFEQAVADIEQFIQQPNQRES